MRREERSPQMIILERDEQKDLKHLVVGTDEVLSLLNFVMENRRS